MLELGAGDNSGEDTTGKLGANDVQVCSIKDPVKPGEGVRCSW